MHTKLARQAPAQSPNEALQMTRRGLQIRLSLLSPHDQKVAGSYGNMAIFAIATGQYEDSLVYSSACLKIRTLQAETQATNICCTYLYFGWCYAKTGRLDEAEESLSKAMSVLENKFGLEGAKDMPQYTWILTAQAFVHLQRGEEEESFKKDQEVFWITQSKYRHPLPRTFQSVYKMAWWARKDTRLQDALDTAIWLMENLEKVDHYAGHLARASNLLSQIYADMGRTSESKAYRDKAFRLARSVEGPEWGTGSDYADFDELVFFHDR